MSNWLSDTGHLLGLASMLLSALALIYSLFNSIRLARTSSQLMSSLSDAERRHNANLSDLTDRELRKILLYIAGTGTRRRFNFHMDEETIRRDEDFYVFVDAFESIEPKYRKIFTEGCQSDDSYKKARFLRNLIVHSHYSTKIGDLEYLLHGCELRDEKSAKQLIGQDC